MSNILRSAVIGFSLSVAGNAIADDNQIEQGQKVSAADFYNYAAANDLYPMANGIRSFRSGPFQFSSKYYLLMDQSESQWMMVTPAKNDTYKIVQKGTNFDQSITQLGSLQVSYHVGSDMADTECPDSALSTQDSLRQVFSGLTDEGTVFSVYADSAAIWSKNHAIWATAEHDVNSTTCEIVRGSSFTVPSSYIQMQYNTNALQWPSVENVQHLSQNGNRSESAPSHPTSQPRALTAQPL